MVRFRRWIQWIEATASDLESGVSRVTAKAILGPAELSLEDKMQPDSLLQKRIYVWSHDYFVLNMESDNENAEGVLNNAIIEAPQIFGSRFSRAWLLANKYWIDPEIYDAINEGLEGASLTSELDYFKSIDAIAASLE